MASIARLVVSLGANISDFETDMKRAANLSKRELAKMERQAEQLNKKWNKNFKLAGAAVATALGVAIKKAAEFENAIAEVSTLLDDTSSLERTTEAVKDLSVQFGQSAVTEAKALYQIISAGASDAATQVELLTASNRLAVGGMTDVATAADGLTTVLNAYAGTGLDSTRASDVLFTTMKQGKTTIEELSSTIGNVATIAAQTGVSLEEVGAAVGTLTKSGIATSESMNALRGVLAAVLKQSDQSVKAAKELGVAFDITALRAKGLQGFLADIAKTGATEEQLAKLFGRVEGLSAVMALGANNALEFTSQLEAQAKAAGATSDAVGKAMQSTAFRVAQAREAFNKLSIEIGTRFLSAVSGAATTLVNNIDKVEQVIESVAAVVITRVGVGMTAAFLKAAAAGRALATVMAFVGGPVGLLATGVALLVVNWDDLLQRQDRLGEFTRQLSRGFTVLMGVVRAVIAELLNLANAAVNITQIVGAPITAMIRQFQAAQDAIRSGDFTGALQAIGGIVAESGREASAALEELKGNLSDVGSFARFIEDAWNESLKAFTETGASAEDKIRELEEAAAGFLKRAAANRAAAEAWTKAVIGGAKQGKAEVEKLSDAVKKSGLRLLLVNQVWKEGLEILDELIDKQKEYEDTLASIEDRFNPIGRLVRQFEAEQRALSRAHREGELTAEEYQARINFLTDALGKAAAATIDVKKETDVWAEAMREAVRILERSFTSAWENILDGAGNMFDNILDGFKTLLASMLHQLITSPLIKHLQELFKDGGPGFAGFDFGKLGQTLAGLGGVGLGALLGGGGTGAGIGSALGTLLGTALTSSAGPFGQIAGKIIGGLLGGLFGGLFDDDPDFELQLVGSNVLGSAALQGRTGPLINSALGGFAVTNTGDFESADIEKFVAGVRDFDNAFAQFLDAGQLERVTELLKDWGIELDGAAATLENFIGSRLDQIQFALDGAVRAWVESAESLEEEIARTGVAFLTESLFSQRPELFANRTQAEFLAVVEAFQNGTETITDAFAEVVQLIDAIVSATNVLEDFSASDLVSDYERFARLQNETPLESLTRQYIEFSDAVANFDGTPAQLSDIASRVISIRNAEIAALQQIDAIQKGINSNLDRLRQDVLNVFEGPKTGRQLFVEAAGLVDLVAQAETPEEIAALADQFDAVIRQFSQDDMARIGDTLVNLIDRFQQASNDSLARVRQSTIDSAQSMRDIADAFLTTIPDTLALIAASNEDAAAALVAIAGGEINTTEFDPTGDINVDIAGTISDGLTEQADVLRVGTNMMTDALRDGTSDLAANIAAAIQNGFAGANVNVSVVVQDNSLVNR